MAALFTFRFLTISSDSRPQHLFAGPLPSCRLPADLLPASIHRCSLCFYLQGVLVMAVLFT